MNSIPKLGELLELKSFRTKTSMYIGEKKISNLKAFLDGILYSFEAYQIENEWVFDDFHDWVAEYYGWRESTYGWKNIIMKECSGDEVKSIEEFFKLYDKFKKEKSS